MPKGQIAFAGDVNAVDDEQQFPLGTQVTLGPNMTPGSGLANLGMQTWTYVKMTGSAAVAGNIVSTSASPTAPFEVVLTPAASNISRVVGAAQFAIAQDKFGWVVSNGPAEVLAGAAGITVSLGLIAGAAAGVAVAAAAVTGNDFGVALESATTGVLATCMLNSHR